MAKFINRNKALERSNDAHIRLSNIMYGRKDIVSSDYHMEVFNKQYKQNRILTRKERSRIFNKMMKKYHVD